ncbi:hypothetical protein [Dokdonia pacifica]|uniref:TonB protein C-terminal n=1 Tax=Dokdonia pacifica TaxID=1627892 RepID=A0A238ZYH8_9FLAO|nr:hypothetical protein [Dokdonia pacifica]SNR88061.1 hypothetical protein SAMN06265376_1049 [Dokdonia pacifica]
MRLLSLALCMLIASCSRWETKKITTEDFLSQEQYIIDITNVDTYPIFNTCDELSESAALKKCFEDQVTSTLYQELSNHTIVVQESINDTVWLDLIVNETGKFCLDSIHLKPMIRKEIPELNAWIHDAIQVMPKPEPAIKRGILVKTRFKVPIVLKVD